MNLQTMMSSEDQTHETPDEILDRVRYCLGGIDLDPATGPHNPTKAEVYITPEVDGLQCSWWGRWFCNPPYGRAVGKWVDKAIAEQPNTLAGCLLVAARTDTRWFHKAIDRCHCAVFFKGRLTFRGAAHGAPFPSVMFYFGPSRKAFVTAFDGCGWFYR